MDGRFTAKEVFEARDRIRDYVYKTPLEQSIYLGRDGREYFFKLESLQTVKSFKIRGAINKMLTLTDEQRKKGVVAISSGNHGASVSYGAKLLGIEKAVRHCRGRDTGAETRYRHHSRSHRRRRADNRHSCRSKSHKAGHKDNRRPDRGLPCNDQGLGGSCLLS